MLGLEEEETSAAARGGHARPGGQSWGRGRPRAACPFSFLLPQLSPGFSVTSPVPWQGTQMAGLLETTVVREFWRVMSLFPYVAPHSI